LKDSDGFGIIRQNGPTSWSFVHPVNLTLGSRKDAFDVNNAFPGDQSLAGQALLDWTLGPGSAGRLEVNLGTDALGNGGDDMLIGGAGDSLRIGGAGRGVLIGGIGSE